MLEFKPIPLDMEKTLSMVTLIARDKMPWDLNESHVVDSQWTCRYYKVSYDTRLVRINTTLILTSHSCFNQWLDDLGHVGDALKVITIKSQKDIARFKPSDAWDVAVVTPTMYNRLILSQDVAWKRFIFDEPAQVKVRAMKEIVTGFTWLVSATPGYIARKPIEHQLGWSTCSRFWLEPRRDTKFRSEESNTVCPNIVRYARNGIQRLHLLATAGTPFERSGSNSHQ